MAIADVILTGLDAAYHYANLTHLFNAPQEDISPALLSRYYIRLKPTIDATLAKEGYFGFGLSFVALNLMEGPVSEGLAKKVMEATKSFAELSVGARELTVDAAEGIMDLVGELKEALPAEVLARLEKS